MMVVWDDEQMNLQMTDAVRSLIGRVAKII